MKKTLLSLAIATTITLPVASFANNDSDAIQASFDRGFDKGSVEVISTTANEYDPLHQLINVALYNRDGSNAGKKTDFDSWNQVVNIAHEYRNSSDLSGAIWASLEHGFDKKTEFDPWNQLVNVAHDYRGGSGAIWASFERGFDNIKPVTVIVQTPVAAPANVLTQNVWTHHLITGVGFTTKI